MADDRECFLCLEGVDISKGKLFRPCRCSHIHENCLDELRVRNNRYTYECPTCRYTYKMSRVWFARLITHPVTITIFSLLTIIISVITVVWFIRFFAYLFIGVKLTHRAFALSGKIVWWSILIIGFTTMIIALIGDRDGDLPVIPVRNFDFTYIDPYFFEFMGYGFSLMGFGLFIKSVYNWVHIYATLLLSVCGQRVLEVSLV
ncbi:MAG: hypothetical protein PHG66_00250 [Candidatus Colwellbacteria bacterium]|nr:hypothetical protein [Candidatus Colwellbacteria bacterium]